jgi:sodium-dependent dicarboxylate transporter 2/3/5
LKGLQDSFFCNYAQLPQKSCHQGRGQKPWVVGGRTFSGQARPRVLCVLNNYIIFERSMHPRYAKPLSLLGGILIAFVLWQTNPFGVGPHAAKVLAVAGLMITWWVSEALPMPVVALMPLILFPLLQLGTLKETAAPYANPVIFLFLGGFMLGLAIQKWNLHRRIALNVIRFTGSSGNRIIMGFIAATGMLSMWLSNTATTMMMFPIALSVIQVMEERHHSERGMRNFSLVLLLAIAYASNIGGIATIIGTPPNAVYVAHIYEKYGIEISFLQWALLCTPLSVLLLCALYWVLVRWMFPNHLRSDAATAALIRTEIERLGPIRPAEKRVLVVLIITGGLWITRGIINSVQDFVRLDDTIIALLGTLALFVLPSGERQEARRNNGGLLVWKDTEKMAWGILLLFGGGIALANALEHAGLMEDLGQWLAGFSGNTFMLMVTVVVVSMFISEVMSNVAQVIVLAPVLSSLADVLQLDPVLLGIPMTLAASCASMLPMGTPPNAIVFASGRIRFMEMVQAGFVMNIISIILITLFCWLLLPTILSALI